MHLVLYDLDEEETNFFVDQEVSAQGSIEQTVVVFKGSDEVPKKSANLASISQVHSPDSADNRESSNYLSNFCDEIQISSYL